MESKFTLLEPNVLKIIYSHLTTVYNDNFSFWHPTLSSFCFNLVDNIHSSNHLAKYNMTAIQPVNKTKSMREFEKIWKGLRNAVLTKGNDSYELAFCKVMIPQPQYGTVESSCANSKMIDTNNILLLLFIFDWSQDIRKLMLRISTSFTRKKDRQKVIHNAINIYTWSEDK